MGGEKFTRFYYHARHMGSPPHGRGKDYFVGCWRCSVGITPAWAGKRRCSRQLEVLTQDHPRMGGEKQSD